MLNRRVFLAVGAAAVLSGCSGGGDPVSALLSISQADPRPVDVTQLPAMRVTRWQVLVPETLTVSESNMIKPVADIVWRGDPFGDRHAQVQAIMEEGTARAAARMKGNLPVTVLITVKRFHALTEKTRYAYFGEHEIVFDLELRNSDSGDVVVPRYTVDATFRAYTQYEALDAERRGITQKSRILEQLEQRLFQEFTGAPAQNIDESPLIVGDHSTVEGDQILPLAPTGG